MFKTERISAFSDGVIAIAITLLVLGIEVPSAHKVTESDLIPYLKESIDSVLGFISSFVLIGTYWLMHYALFHFITRADRMLVAFNSLFLLVVSFMPFPTGLQAVYRDDEFAMAFYCLSQILCGLALLVIWIYAASHQLVPSHLTTQIRRGVTRQVAIAPMISAVALGVSFLSITLSRLVLLSIPVFYFTCRAYDNAWRPEASNDLEAGDDHAMAAL